MNWQHWLALALVITVAGCAVWVIAQLAKHDDESGKWWDDEL